MLHATVREVWLTSNTASLNFVSTFMTVTSAVACLLRFDIVNVRMFFVLHT